MNDAAIQSLDAFLQKVPYVRFLGMRVELAGDEMTAVLPFSQHLIGNPMLPAIHGGVIGAFLELTALAQLSLAQPAQRVPKTVDITIEYLRSGRAQDTYARAILRKVGRRVANVQVEAWQDSRAQPIAGLTGHFLLRNEPRT
ncbi:MAG: PaaI family thioesterase [Alphaproteobacteria bacterium]|nr:PaaI family thioesterase [Alphaproteobacteria bacterium]MBU1517088.1 PaaI family thioesterase [Alphaproteobacteria bacterium]MBU2093707.1 PaaI family thioesterase [Alphaproteobacteria bacterium]MBU2153971.1 PaaI family thioesterase [Alphaproteobacteria bacterium]MBU2308693.1 PaaI family thioesterase [Alphaproteobacteria bacterium]